MKNVVISILFTTLLSGCMTDKLPLEPDKVTKIVLGTGWEITDTDKEGRKIVRDETKTIAILNKPKSIKNFIDNFSFGNERNLTVKHRFWHNVAFYSSNEIIAHFRFEYSSMRFQGKEYTMSRKSHKMLQEYIK